MPGARPSLDDVRRGIKLANRAGVDMKDVVRAAKWGIRFRRLIRKLPGVEMDIAPRPRGVFEDRNAGFRGDDRMGAIRGARNSWLTGWALKPLNKAINKAVFDPPKTFRRKPRPGERALYDSEKGGRLK